MNTRKSPWRHFANARLLLPESGIGAPQIPRDERLRPRGRIALEPLAVAVTALALWSLGATANEPLKVVADASIRDGEATFIGVNHVGLSVRDLERMLAFYREATGFELIRRETISESEEADRLFGAAGISYEVAVLKAPNMLLELRQFHGNEAIPVAPTPPQGPGMTHTCYQSRAEAPGWGRFMRAGATALSRGGEPVDLGGYGVTYGYAYDPEGNMMELEQLDGERLEASGYDVSWRAIDEALWMSQVALVTHDLERLMAWYAEVLAFAPYRVSSLRDNPRADAIANIDGLALRGGWFRISESSKVLEFWQYLSPPTREQVEHRNPNSLGYSFSFEVEDVDAEYHRLQAMGVEFISRPVDFRGFRQVYARDIDGNVFALRQALDLNSSLSVRQLEGTEKGY